MNESLVLKFWAELKKLDSAIATMNDLTSAEDRSLRLFISTLESLQDVIYSHPTYEFFRKEVEEIEARRYVERNRLAAQRRVQQKQQNSQAAPRVA